MPHYIDGFIVVVEKKKLPQYTKMTKLAAKLWMEHGALGYRECVGDDLNVGFGRTFPKLTKSKPSQLVVFSWIEFKSRAHRDKVNARVMKDDRLVGPDPKDAPFESKNMSYGGFKVFVSRQR